MIAELRQALDACKIAYDDINEGEDEGALLAQVVERLLAEPANVQALALARRMPVLARVHPGDRHVQIVVGPFDLPDGYWLVRFGDGFECGIAPDGSVSS